MSTNPRPPEEDPIRSHTYDGIEEFDKKLPNWWLWTFYGAIIFSLAYWFLLHRAGGSLTPQEKLDKNLAALTAKAAARSTGPLTDTQLWAMSRDPGASSAGQATFNTTCASCHGANLQGGIGANLVDATWIHGGNPTQIVQTITNGVQAKGMPSWGPVLGARKINEVAAYILSHHQPPASSP
ncbi:MAG: cbb3-type cytochrome c oxidase N-terminal domain-containing protein [Candidatus Methylacidiphilales bacterium]|nr:cbb3-type cytochrome c oxidase N-terminal domain-containing protein [Candidatus Methylacidiphilales bacterium]